VTSRPARSPWICVLLTPASIAPPRPARKHRRTAFARIQLFPGFLCRHRTVRTSDEQMGASMSNPSFERSCFADAHARRRGLLGGAGGCAWDPDKIGVGVGSNETRLASRRGRLHGEPLVSASLGPHLCAGLSARARRRAGSDGLQGPGSNSTAAPLHTGASPALAVGVDSTKCAPAGLLHGGCLR